MKSKVQEIIILRSIACLTVVFIHAITRSPSTFDSVNKMDIAFSYLQLLLMYGTPMFVFISEFVLAYNYKDRIPDKFISKRIKFILLPFICMGIFYAGFSEHANGIQATAIQSVRNIFLGDYHGYFILIIFQFYFLHMIFNKVKKKISPKLVLISALCINLAYLSFFNFVEPFNVPTANYIWYRFSWIPFIGWIIYFVIGYYAGSYYEYFKSLLTRNLKWIILSWCLTGALFLLFQYFNVLNDISSKRVDALLYTISTIMVFFYIATKIKNIPRFLLLINRYSFGIYLLHPFFQQTIGDMILINIPYLNNLYGSLFLYFIIGVIVPIPVVYLLNKIKIGAYIVGKV
ncbi:acyltransferase family protein [Bacillus sp. DX4.1]|uniref:acyltransferase family protein n=1 Tax=Bacillus sp. DX4.1 TaxID=3055867 RepID=UPI0025A1254B|nr:acyltransferase family protein [Bacillus sp. DX4.1]MDM5187915.1 acyltransferase family protein [Bacillus sp. DX4.1]